MERLPTQTLCGGQGSTAPTSAQDPRGRPPTSSSHEAKLPLSRGARAPVVAWCREGLRRSLPSLRRGLPYVGLTSAGRRPDAFQPSKSARTWVYTRAAVTARGGDVPAAEGGMARAHQHETCHASWHASWTLARDEPKWLLTLGMISALRNPHSNTVVSCSRGANRPRTTIRLTYTASRRGLARREATRR